MTSPPPADLQARIQDAVAALQQGQVGQAGVMLEAARRLWPGNPDVLHLCGVCALQAGDVGNAVDALQAAVSAAPDVVEFRFNYALSLRRAGRPVDALTNLRSATALRPDFVAAHRLLAETAQEIRDYDSATLGWRNVVRLRGDDVEALLQLGQAELAAGLLGDAVTTFGRVTALAPGLSKGWNNLGVALSQMGAIGAGLAAFGRAAAVDPGVPRLQGNYARALADAGRIDEALAQFDQALARAPGDPMMLSNRLMTLLYSDRHAAPEIVAEHRNFEDAIGAVQQPPATRVGRRPLRVAYLSPDFQNHPVAYFIEGVLKAHDRSAVTPILYACGPKSDDWTARLFALADTARFVGGLDDDELAAQVRADDIDILVDLAGHTAYNRMPALARRLAPIQVNYLGYPFTTGLSAIDYRLTDVIADPEGTDSDAAETLLRLSRSYYAYSPPVGVPEIAPLPMCRNGYPTFGVCSNLSKVSATTLDLWSDLLREIPGARLRWRAKSFADPETAKAMRAELGKRGIVSDRVDCLPWAADTERWAVFSTVDVALDTFPYNQATSTCEALWMGVPTLTLRGTMHQARMGASIMTAAGLPGFVAEDAAHWLACGRSAIADPVALADLRMTMRDQLRGSPLLDAVGLTREIESFYREITAAF